MLLGQKRTQEEDDVDEELQMVLILAVLVLVVHNISNQLLPLNVIGNLLVYHIQNVGHLELSHEVVFGLLVLECLVDLVLVVKEEALLTNKVDLILKELSPAVQKYTLHEVISIWSKISTLFLLPQASLDQMSIVRHLHAFVKRYVFIKHLELVVTEFIVAIFDKLTKVQGVQRAVLGGVLGLRNKVLVENNHGVLTPNEAHET